MAALTHPTEFRDLDERFTSFVSETLPDPRPFYAELRERVPVYRTPFGFWYLTRYEDVQESTRLDAEFPVNNPAAGPPPDSYAFQVAGRFLLQLEGAEHARIRGQVSTAFAGRALERMRGKVRSSIENQLRTIGDRDEIELVHDFSLGVPTRVILDLLGIGEEYLETYTAVADAFISLFEPDVTAETISKADAVFLEATTAMLTEADRKRQDPADDLLTLLVAARDRGELETDDELVALALFLITAGHETTANTLSTGLYHLLARPEVLERFRTDDSVTNSAVEELLRYDGAVRNVTPRYAAEDRIIGDQLIKKGDMVWPSLQAANHDPSVFADPLTLDITRTPNRHLAFGAGAHRCLGNVLARMELAEGLRAFLNHYKEIEPAGDAVWRQSFVVRGLESFPLRIKKA
nr:cytochrome P450 [Rhodococcus wratislaviensis]GLK33168.1 cytochrome P-450 like protein [Rhodococcus wratislaviensis]